MLVKNEERWIWFAVQSVLPAVDGVLVVDTGSSDRTLDILKTIRANKLVVEEREAGSREELVNLRNEMLKRTKTDWFLLVDGDEIWPKPALAKLAAAIETAPAEVWGIVVRTRNCVGDVWHFQPEEAGRYELLGRKGHLTIRAYRKLPGFRWQGVYPNEAYCDGKGNPLNGQDDHLAFVDVAYWHVTHLLRTSSDTEVIDRKKKYKLEIGTKANRSELPDIFFAARPSIVPSPWIKFSTKDRLMALVATPLRALKRKIVP
ncbi:MAG: hypothetical protein A2900_03565 [Candidatus Chisholmbacteria bacterium RIFCSPLOWO2_01_FULL_50_28]|uniref:Glycosyltransferase 2-like domain-containing protein n=1 Tax=Candidatus Chisholmbacteria bacterium RIFCSPHIGHO2_01_FULL_52_32 TaxID=1797591 RepID=A0A1G1VSU1_9BACT|nr:MAG: hypothetical protein A2786_03180 [Candidatus Chisholmbacteria bacterium RIFCSPHIGHO2_01_FULL_52_32]OGY20154.1 MAG: hypothetical protein A2900_03565 [Candidatus Chisholmbacteria bacterium RIFCSPLOWO2_01_FULL_50_28]